MKDDIVETVTSTAKDYDDLIAQMMKFHQERKDRATGSTEVSIFTLTLGDAQNVFREISKKVKHLPFKVSIEPGHKGQWQVILSCYGGYDLKVYNTDVAIPTILGLPDDKT